MQYACLYVIILCQHISLVICIVNIYMYLAFVAKVLVTKTHKLPYNLKNAELTYGVPLHACWRGIPFIDDFSPLCITV